MRSSNSVCGKTEGASSEAANRAHFALIAARIAVKIIKVASEVADGKK